MHTVKYQNRWNPKKKRCGTQLANCFGSNAGFSALTSRPSARNKENTPTSPSSSHNTASPYRRTPTNLITSDDALLALRLRSKTYENRCRNLTRRVSRSVDRKKQLEQRVQDLQKELNATRKSTSTYSASLQRQLDAALAELDNRKQNEIKLHARNLVLTRKQGALSKKVARIPNRIQMGVAKLSSHSLKEGGVISTKIRACVRDLVAHGAPLEGIGKIIHSVAKGLDIKINDNISTRSAGRIVIEGGVAAQLQIVDAVKNTERVYLDFITVKL